MPFQNEKTAADAVLELQQAVQSGAGTAEILEIHQRLSRASGPIRVIVSRPGCFNRYRSTVDQATFSYVAHATPLDPKHRKARDIAGTPCFGDGIIGVELGVCCVINTEGLWTIRFEDVTSITNCLPRSARP